MRSCANKSTFKWSPAWCVPVTKVWPLPDKQEDVCRMSLRVPFISHSVHYIPSRAFWREGPRAEPAQKYSLLAPAPVQLPSQLPGDGLQVHEVAEAAPRALSAGEQNSHTRYTTPPLLPAPPGPARTYPISYWRKQASLKSVTGESSAWIGWPLNQRLFKSITAFSASSSRETWHIRSPRGGLRGCHRHSSPPPPHTSPPFLWKPPQRIHHNVLASLHCTQRSANRQQTGKSFEGYGKGEGNGLAEGRFIVQPRASVSMTTCSNFEIKWTVDFVFLGAEDGGQVLRHFPLAADTAADARDKNGYVFTYTWKPVSCVQIH